MFLALALKKLLDMRASIPVWVTEKEHLLQKQKAFFAEFCK